MASRYPVLATLRPIHSMVFNDRLNFNGNATGTETRKLALSFKYKRYIVGGDPCDRSFSQLSKRKKLKRKFAKLPQGALDPKDTEYISRTFLW